MIRMITENSIYVYPCPFPWIKLFGRFLRQENKKTLVLYAGLDILFSFVCVSHNLFNLFRNHSSFYSFLKYMI